MTYHFVIFATTKFILIDWHKCNELSLAANVKVCYQIFTHEQFKLYYASEVLLFLFEHNGSLIHFFFEKKKPVCCLN